MRYRTFLVTGVEVLHLGGQASESDSWSPQHWRENKGRWRLFTSAVDDYVSSEVDSCVFGPTVGGLVIALEIADFAAWPAMAFAPPQRPHSYKPKYKDLWCFAKLNWPDVMYLTLTEQYRAYTDAVLSSVRRLAAASRKPRDLDVEAMHQALAAVFNHGKPSHFTRAASLATTHV